MAVFYRRLPQFKYISAETVDDALSCLVEYRQKARLLAGGTDLIPQFKQREIPIPEYVIDIKGIAGLEAITYDPESGLKIGALADDGVNREIACPARTLSNSRASRIEHGLSTDTKPGNFCWKHLCCCSFC